MGNVMRGELRRIVVAAVAAVATIGLILRAAPSTDVVSFTVKGRSNATPWVAAEGSFVAVAWGATVAGKSDVFVAVSRDAGRSFGVPVQVNAVAGEARLGGEFPPRVALASGGAAGVPEIAVLWTARTEKTEIRIARSRDGGRTFGTPVTLQSPGAPGDRGWPALALDRRGAAHAIWLDHRGLAAGHQSGAAHDGEAMAQKSRLYYAAEKGSASAERELAKGVCYCCKTALAVGADGALYAAWRHVYAGSLRDMAFTVSRDGGRSFSPPARVSEDRWAIDGCPDDGPSIAVDARGTIHLIWPTVISGPKLEGALFYASSRDGHTFTARTRIPTLGGPRPSHPQIVVDRTGKIVVAWDELIEGRRVAAARELKVRSDRRVDLGSIVALSTDGPGTYPVLATTPAGLLAVWTTGGEASVVKARTIPLP